MGVVLKCDRCSNTLSVDEEIDSMALPVWLCSECSAIPPTPQGVTQELYKRVYDAMDGNINVVRLIPEVLDAVWTEAHRLDEGDLWVSRHPLMRILADKFNNLTFRGTSAAVDILDDYKFVREHAEGTDLSAFSIKTRKEE